MSTARWKFVVTVPPGEFGNVAVALRKSGFTKEESERLDNAIFDTTELFLSIPKDSVIDPAALVENLRTTGLIVRWLNQPAV
ncbi:MAG: hypothetical protein IGS38_09355 [Synechococcales cyanobacterium M58_A2018_015]|jgi:hypothetical protein|nr:hypothetical protein [Synechococcales cyanobacterium M58_A2018_015]